MITLATVLERHRDDFLYSGKLDSSQFSAFNSLRICRTAEAQGSLYCCNDCQEIRYAYHSCGHRFCPNCQNYKTTLWLHRQKSRLLPCDYFMITFTVPSLLRKVARENKELFYKALFKASSEALKNLCNRKLKGECAAIAVLHSNTRKLDFHPHIHFIVPAIVLNKKEQTIKKITSKFFLHHAPLSKLFRAKLLAYMEELNLPFPHYLYGKKWNVNCQNKGNGQGCLEYLSRYLMKGVVSEKALTQKGDKISLRYQESESKKMKTLEFSELDFLKRLADHVKPKGFRTVREYGFLAPAAKKTLKRIQLLLHANLPVLEIPEMPKMTCPCCHGEMIVFLRKVSEDWWRSKIEARERPPPGRRLA